MFRRRQAWSRALPRFLLSETDMWIDMLRGNEGGSHGAGGRAQFMPAKPQLHMPH